METKQNYNYGESPSAPSQPTRNGYIFTGWDKELSAVTGSEVYTALWTESGSTSPFAVIGITIGMLALIIAILFGLYIYFKHYKNIDLLEKLKSFLKKLFKKQ